MGCPVKLPWRGCSYLSCHMQQYQHNKIEAFGRMSGWMHHDRRTFSVKREINQGNSQCLRIPGTRRSLDYCCVVLRWCHGFEAVVGAPAAFPGNFVEFCRVAWWRFAHRLGALQRNPTGARAIFSSLSERIRSDLGAEEAAVYIDVGDGTLWLLPTGSGEEGPGGGDGDGGGCCGGEEEEVFIQRGVGVVGLVAMGALPGVAAVPAGGGERAGCVDGGVDVLLLNDGLEAFDNGTTVEAALIRAARRRRGNAGGSEGGEVGPAASGNVRNMLLAR